MKKFGIKATTLLVLVALLSGITPASADTRSTAIWDKLQSSNPLGYVLLMRHALAPGNGDPENFTLGDCSTQRNLSEEGRKDAQDIGLESGEGVVVKADKNGEIKVFGFTPIP